MHEPSAKAPTTTLDILLAEDDANLRSMLSIVLRREGHRVVEFRNGADLRDHLHRQLPPGTRPPENLLVISDLRMPEVDGLSLIRGLYERGQRPNFILLTAFGSPEVHAAAGALGALRVLDKPFDFDDLRVVIRVFAQNRTPV